MNFAPQAPMFRKMCIYTAVTRLTDPLVPAKIHEFVTHTKHYESPQAIMLMKIAMHVLTFFKTMRIVRPGINLSNQLYQKWPATPTDTPVTAILKPLRGL